MTPQEMKIGAKVLFKRCQEAPMTIRPAEEKLTDGEELQIIGFPFVLAKDKQGKLHTIACHEVEEER